MFEKLKALFEWFEFVRRYPGWLQLVLLIWLLLGAGLVSAMVVMYPKPDNVRIIQLSKVPNFSDGIAFQVRVANSGDAQADLTSLELTFYQDAIPPTEGALQSTEQISGRYVVTEDKPAGQLSAQLNSETDALQATIQFPITGRKDYAILSVDLAQNVASKGSDRFQIAIKAADFPPKDAKYVRAVIFYGENDKTKEKVAPLSR
jgi:ABC-type Na+ efflux pump permease subunit